jgi:hypothetical protein
MTVPRGWATLESKASTAWSDMSIERKSTFAKAAGQPTQRGTAKLPGVAGVTDSDRFLR